MHAFLGSSPSGYRAFVVSLALYYSAFASSGVLFALTGWSDRRLAFLLLSLLLAAFLLTMAGSIARLAGREGAEARNLLLVGLEAFPRLLLVGVLAAVALGVLSTLFSLPAALMVLARAEPVPIQWFYVSQVLLLLISTFVATFFLLWALDSVRCGGARLGMLLRAAARGFLWFLLLFVALAAAVRLSTAALGIADFFIFGLFKQYLTAKAFSVALSAATSGLLVFLFFSAAAALYRRTGLPSQAPTPGGASCSSKAGAGILALLVIALNAAYLLIEPSIPSLRLAALGVAALRQIADSPKLTNVEVSLRSFNTAAVDALCIKALSLTAAGDANGAAKLFGFADEIDDTQESLYLARGIHELAIGDVQRASDDFRKLVWMNGRSAEAWWYLGELEDMAEAGRGRLAKKNAFRLDEMILFKTSVAKPGSRPQQWLWGQVLVGEGLFASALRAIDGYALKLKLSRDRASAVSALYSQLSEELAGVQKAVFGDARIISPRIAEWWADHLLVCAMTEHDVGQQIRQFVGLLKDLPDNEARTRRLGLVVKEYFAYVDTDLMKQLFDRYPESADIELAYAKRLVTASHHRDAREVVARLLGRDAKDVEARKLLVTLDSLDGKDKDAENGALELLSEGVEDPAIHSVLGNIYQDRYFSAATAKRAQEDLDRAVSHYEKCIAMDPSNFVHYRNLAEVYYKAKDYVKAREYADKAVSLLGDALAFGTPQWFWHSGEGEYTQATAHNWGVFVEFADEVKKAASRGTK